MNKNMHVITIVNFFRRIVFLGLLGMMFAGCAKFTPTTSADLTPFAEQTIAMLGGNGLWVQPGQNPSDSGVCRF